jgi:hypothetical protein
MKRTASTSPGTAPRTAIGPVRQWPLRLLLAIAGTFSPGNVCGCRWPDAFSERSTIVSPGRRSVPAAGHGRTPLLSSTVTGRAGGGSCTAIFPALPERGNARTSSPTPSPATQTTPAASPWRASAPGARPPLPLPEQPAGPNAEHPGASPHSDRQTRLPPGLTADFRPATAFHPCLSLRNPAAPTAQIIQVCARRLDAIPALLAVHSGASVRLAPTEDRSHSVSATSSPGLLPTMRSAWNWRRGWLASRSSVCGRRGTGSPSLAKALLWPHVKMYAALDPVR